MSSSHSSLRAAATGLRASVIIPTYNRRAVLVRVLRALAKQTVPADLYEVLVVADGCTDGTGAVCRELADEMPYSLRLIEQDNAGPAAARNHGVREAHAPLIVFIDDDVVPSAELLEAHLAAHAPDGDDTVIAIGPLLPPPDVRLNAWGAWEERTLCGHYAAMESGRWTASHRHFYTGNASLVRQRILEAGGFDPQFRRAEDIELGSRLEAAGCTFAFLPHARAWHYVRRSFASWAAMPCAYGRASVMMGRTGRLWIVEIDFWCYSKRNPAVRLLTRLCLGSQLRTTIATGALRLIATAGWFARLSPLAYAACSLMYNMRHYEGLAAELGSSQIFWHLVDAAAATRRAGMSDIFLAACASALESKMSAAQHEPVHGEIGASV